MSSKMRKKTELPLQVVTEGSKMDDVIITIDSAPKSSSMAKGKEEAGKPLYLKRV